MAAMLSAACAPTTVPMGPAVAAPSLNDERFTAADGAVLPVRVWRPESNPFKAVVLALHGFNDYSNSFDDAAKFWAGRGIVTYAYDQRGFGRAPNREKWAGVATMVADLRAVADRVGARHPGVPFYLLGDSMGGAVVLAALAGTKGRDAIADGAVLVAPAVWGRALMNPVQSGFLWLLAHTIPWYPLTGQGLRIKPSDNIEMLKALGKDPLVIKTARVEVLWGLTNLMDAALDAVPRLDETGPRALVLYGMKDEIVPNEPSLAMLDRLPRNAARVAIYKGGYHMLLRDLKARTAWQDIAAWIAAPEAPLPSGADAQARDVMEQRRKGR